MSSQADLPLQVVRSWISVFSIRTKRTYITRRVVNKSMTLHLVFALEAFPAFGTLAAFNGTVVRSFGGVDVHVRSMFVAD